MPLPAGTKLGPYEIVELIGAGGMGEVYRATDPRLQREVAIKVSAEAFNERFAREARAIASLNHANICTLFDVGPNYLVMELIDGQTLADRIREGAIPLDEALTIARQIADALEAAHEKGIVHRDLKPGNVKITDGGVVKVLDFGLAKLAGPAPESSPSLTVTMGSTQAGVILGTASYMSPEQAKGKPVDKRADIWAFGVVLHEMLTGQKLFERDTLSETLAGVLKEPPDLTLVPPHVRPLLKRCLEKDPKKRLRDIGDAMALLESAAEPVAPLPAASVPARRLRWLWPSAAVVFLITTLIISGIHFRETPAAARLLRFTIPVPEAASFTPGLFSVSPNGRYVVFGARSADGVQRLWLRDLEELESKPLPGTERSGNPIPFWSPDSRFVVFDPQGSKLKKIDVAGGTPQIICDVPRGGALGGSWSADDVILFGSSLGVMRVPAAGGVATPVTSRDTSRKENAHLSPSFLPDGKHFVYSRISTVPENNGLFEGALDVKPEQQNSRPLLTAAVPVYVPSADETRGQVLFLRDGTLLAQRFDNRRRRLSGDPVPVAEQVGMSYGGALGRFASSASGILIYRGGDSLELQLTWYDRGGKAIGKVGDPGLYSVMALSRDGTKAAVSRSDPRNGNDDVWVMDLAQGTSSRLTFDPAPDYNPVFSPDGSRVAFASYRGGTSGLYVKATNGAGSEETLLQPSPGDRLTDWSPDGRFLIFGAGDPLSTWILPIEGDRKPFSFARSQFAESAAQLSPDGRWIMYRSGESGRPEVYVKTFSPSPDAGSSASAGKWMVSRNGGLPIGNSWRRDGKELYYLAPDGYVMAVEINVGSVFHAGAPKPLFVMSPAFLRGNLAAAAPDGQRFLFGVPSEKNVREELTVIVNWTEKLRR